MTALQALQQEFNATPALIEAAMAARDVTTAKRLKARLADLPDEIEQARITDLESRLAALKAQDKTLSVAHQKACATAEKAQEAVNAAQSALSNAVQARQVALSALIANEATKQDIETELRVSIRMQESAMTDVPLLLRESELGEWHMVLRRRAAAEMEMV